MDTYRDCLEFFFFFGFFWNSKNIRDTNLQIKDEKAGESRKAVGGSERERERGLFAEICSILSLFPMGF